MTWAHFPHYWHFLWYEDFFKLNILPNYRQFDLRRYSIHMHLYIHISCIYHICVRFAGVLSVAHIYILIYACVLVLFPYIYRQISILSLRFIAYKQYGCTTKTSQQHYPILYWQRFCGLDLVVCWGKETTYNDVLNDVYLGTNELFWHFYVGKNIFLETKEWILITFLLIAHQRHRFCGLDPVVRWQTETTYKEVLNHVYWLGGKRTFFAIFVWEKVLSLYGRHNDHSGGSKHQSRGCFLNCLFRRRWKKTSKLRVTGLCAPGGIGGSPQKGPVTRKMFPFDDVILSWNRGMNTHKCVVNGTWKVSSFLLLKPEYSGTTKFMPWLLMSWL